MNRLPQRAGARLLGDWSPAGLGLTEPEVDLEVFAVPKQRVRSRRARASDAADDRPSPPVPPPAREASVKSPHRTFPKRLYVVVDELIGDRLTLSVSAWPQLDEAGRVRFPRKNGWWRIGAETSAFAQFLFVHREPREQSTRELRIGDVFDVTRRLRANLDRLEESIPDPAKWMAPPIVDITAEARDVVKAAFYSAVSPVLRPEENERDAMIIAETEQGSPPRQTEA